MTELRYHHGIEVSGDGCPLPFQHFSELQLQQPLVQFLSELGYLVSDSLASLVPRGREPGCEATELAMVIYHSAFIPEVAPNFWHF